jgi:hypothetical protein
VVNTPPQEPVYESVVVEHLRSHVPAIRTSFLFSSQETVSVPSRVEGLAGRIVCTSAVSANMMRRILVDPAAPRHGQKRAEPRYARIWPPEIASGSQTVLTGES